MPQKFYSDSVGIDFLEKHINKRCRSLLVDLRKQYFALMSAAALFEHLQTTAGFSGKSF